MELFMSNFSAARANFQDQAAHVADQANTVLREKAAQASEALREGTEKVQAEANAATKRVRGQVADHPISALAATLAIGAIAGYLIGRR
jgi:ElaB/YqjD/DUF883 family membrane-anchored ribosome-binding protein